MGPVAPPPSPVEIIGVVKGTQRLLKRTQQLASLPSKRHVNLDTPLQRNTTPPSGGRQ